MLVSVVPAAPILMLQPIVPVHAAAPHLGIGLHVPCLCPPLASATSSLESAIL